MSITLTEIITVDEYLEVFPQDSSVEEDAIQSAINRATITLDGICGGMIAKVWSVTEETSSYYRTEQEHQYIKQATILQAQYNVSKNLDFSVGSENYSSGSNNYNETRSRADLVVDETIYQLLAQARVYNPNITTDTTIANTSNLSGFYNPSYDSGDEYITYNVGDNRYIPKNYTTGAGKYLKMDDNGNITYVDLGTVVGDNFYTKTECNDTFATIVALESAKEAFTQEIEALNTYCDNLDATKAGKDYVSASTETKTGVETAQSITIGETSYNLGGSSGATWGSITGTLSNQQDLNTQLTTLQTNIDNEASTRSANDLEISNNLAKEVEARASADSSLQGEISDEATARQTGDSNLQTEIDNINQTTLPTLEESLESQIATKQDTLVSGTTIKTINGETLLGSGNIEISSLSVSQSIKTGSFSLATSSSSSTTVTLSDVGSNYNNFVVGVSVRNTNGTWENNQICYLANLSRGTTSTTLTFQRDATGSESTETYYYSAIILTFA